ncbi:Invasion protein IalB, involved in pathogenesis [Cohaesibacter sp. ES.047]|uniref:invasion associated locus B family protein n=1 Tax=Cohaesibacter sp. ES.047 TaxID=1798205 RepID=UPI000BC00D20|nr:invasion associated locus B family protein [Cohaesibacter sp. ES.047]SNY93329.1 Invasion protein IalB, involved in pathogenesis [Cohaesibacter sp. ES.047]
MVMIDKALKLIKPATAAAAIALVSLAAPSAYAQDNTNAVPEVKNWLKFCNTDQKSQKQLCAITQEKKASTGQFLASISVRELEGAKRKALVIAITPGMLLRHGLTVQIDKGKQLKGTFSICFPNACFSDLAVDENYIEQMKKGATISVTALNQQAQPVRFDLTLSGFTAAYDGEPIDIQKSAEDQKKLQEQLRKRAEEQRQKLLEQKKKSEDGAQ